MKNQMLIDGVAESLYLPVVDYFKGDVGKATLWFNTSNPLLGGVSPLEMINIGREIRLQKFIDRAMEQSMEDKET